MGPFELLRGGGATLAGPIQGFIHHFFIWESLGVLALFIANLEGDGLSRVTPFVGKWGVFWEVGAVGVLHGGPDFSVNFGQILIFFVPLILTIRRPVGGFLSHLGPASGPFKVFTRAQPEWRSFQGLLSFCPPTVSTMSRGAPPARHFNEPFWDPTALTIRGYLFWEFPQF